MNMGGIPHHEHAAFAIGRGETMMQAETRAPADALDLAGTVARPARVENRLDVLDGGPFGGFVYSGNDAVGAVGQWRDDDKSGG